MIETEMWLITKINNQDYIFQLSIKIHFLMCGVLIKWVVNYRQIISIEREWLENKLMIYQSVYNHHQKITYRDYLLCRLTNKTDDLYFWRSYLPCCHTGFRALCAIGLVQICSCCLFLIRDFECMANQNFVCE